MVESRAQPSNAPQETADAEQRGLADSLIECMGRESAIHVCQVNGWDGVLKLLLHDKAGERR